MPRKRIKVGEISPDLKIYTVKEVAGILRLGVDRIRHLIKQGELKAYMHRGSLNLPIIYVLEKDLKRYMESEFLSQYMPGRKKVFKKANKIWN